MEPVKPVPGMLILSRHVGEKIFIGRDVVITLVEIDRNKCRLAIQAPRQMPVFRSELVTPEGQLKHEAKVTR